MNNQETKDRAIKIHGDTYDDLMHLKRILSVQYDKNCTIDGVIKKLLNDSMKPA
jgi:hypothetical protein